MKVDADFVFAVVLHRPHSDGAAVQAACGGGVRRCCGEAEEAGIAHALIAIDLRRRGCDVLPQRVDRDGDLRVGWDANDRNIHAFSVTGDEGGDESDDGGGQDSTIRGLQPSGHS